MVRESSRVPEPGLGPKAFSRPRGLAAPPRAPRPAPAHEPRRDSGQNSQESEGTITHEDWPYMGIDETRLIVPGT